MQEISGRFPRILFVNELPPDSLAMADCVRQLLLGYPAEKLDWWYCREGGRRGLTDLKAPSLHRWLLPARLLPLRRLTGVKAAILEQLWVPLAARHLRRTILAVKPDLVWVLLYGWPILVARKARLKAIRGPKLHVSLWDFPDNADGRKALGAARAQRFVDAIFELIRQADTCDGICEPVLEEITRQTGRKDTVPVHSGFEPHHLKALETMSEAAAEETIRLAYVGTIITEQSFIEMLSALDRARKAVSRPVMLEFFGARGYQNRSWFNREWMLEHGVFSDQGLVESLRRCAWGIVVMDLEGKDPRYSRFSFPNKIGTYLSAGVPVLGFGHQSSSLAHIMKDGRLGRFTAATDQSVLGKFLVEALQVPKPRAVFREAILSCAQTEFNATLIRGRLWKAWGVADSEPQNGEA